MFCTNCGMENRDNARYCFKCGELIRVPKKAKAPPPPATPSGPAAAELPSTPAVSGSLPVTASNKRSTPETLANAARTPGVSSHEESAQNRGYALRDTWPARHWRGELSLATSYWLNGVGLNAGIYFISALLAGATAKPGHDFYAGTVSLMAYWVAILALVIWSSVGIWRSASRTRRGSERAFWPTIAKGAVIVSVLASISTLLAIVNAAIDLKRLAYNVRPLRSGTEIELSGGLGTGISDAFLLQLRANPKVRLVHLNSSGGSLLEAKRLWGLMRSNHLTTYTSSECVSACAIAFLGGEKRLLKEGARLGFHKPTMPGLQGWAIGSKLKDEEGWLIASGVGSEFAHRVMLTAGTTMWYPTPTELMDAHVITGVTRGDDLGISGIQVAGLENERQFETSLLKEPLYQVLRDREPQAYEAFMREMRAALSSGASLAEVRSKTVPLLGEVFQRRIPFASDDALAAYFRLIIAQGTALQKVSPDVCFGWAFPGYDQKSAPTRRYYSSETDEMERDVVAQVLATADTSRSIPSAGEVGPALAKARLALKRSVGPAAKLLAEMSDKTKLAAMNRSDGCRVIIGYYSSVLQLPRRDGARAMRYLMSTSANPLPVAEPLDGRRASPAVER